LYKGYIKKYERIGKYEDNDKYRIDILAVELEKSHAIEWARTAQRNFVRWYLTKSGHGEMKDAVLAAFYTAGSDEWRFSFIKMQYNLDNKKDDFTPAKRYSYLVGKNEYSHTAQEQILPLIKNDEIPTSDELENSFSVEKVTKRFFDEYYHLYEKLKESLDNSLKQYNEIKSEFERKNITSDSFAKKTLGQIVFLYFLQKKGWLGVPQNETWDKGDRRFMQNSFMEYNKHGQNYFNDFLKYLFYEALANERKQTKEHAKDYYPRFDCKIPFLNGGLFEPIGDFDWQKYDLHIPNNLFWNDNPLPDTDKGTGIFNVFDRYNFTVCEDEPLEKEVAVDPEMLGKVFENLLEQNQRKSKGAFYTPREIVHYMCQESLINYLDAKLNYKPASFQKLGSSQTEIFGNEAKKGQLDLLNTISTNNLIPLQDIEIFIRKGLFLIENEKHIEKSGKETGTYTHKIPVSIRKNAALINEALEKVKICDPAIGSGAFPVGLLTEIVSARRVIQEFLPENERETLYQLKWNAIHSSIYGVDIEPSAVDIAKLRLWLSLVVDENDYSGIKPLPNLDYKIVCGNSLLGFPYESQAINKIESLKSKYFEVADSIQKKELKTQINQAINNHLNSSVKSLGYKVDFEYKLHFSEVFNEGKGFDIVIGNPPYVRQERLDTELKQALKINHPKVANGTADLYVYFFSQALKITHENSVIIFITLNKWLKTKYGVELRNYLKEKDVTKIIDFFELDVFEAATDTAITEVINRKPKSETKYFPVKTLANLDIFEITSGKFQKTEKDNTEWSFIEIEYEKIIGKLYENTKPLDEFVKERIYRGITTGSNQAFVLEEETALALLNTKGKDSIKKYVKSSNIKKWEIPDKDGYLLYIPWSFKLKEYSEIEAHLLKFKSILEIRPEVKEKRYEWFAMSRYGSNYAHEFDKNKIIYMHTAKKHEFYLDTEGRYINNSCYMIVSDNKFLFWFLNSKLFDWFKRIKFVAYGDAAEQGRVKLDYNKMITVPIKNISEYDQHIFNIFYDYCKLLYSQETLFQTAKDKLMPVYFEQIVEGLLFETYFKEELQNKNLEIRKHLTNLPELNKISGEPKKMEMIKQVFTELYNENHPIRYSLFMLNTVPEIKTIYNIK